jgi:hypothetical protein
VKKMRANRGFVEFVPGKKKGGDLTGLKKSKKPIAQSKESAIVSPFG